MSGSKKGLRNIDRQLEKIKKSYNETNTCSVGQQIAILDCVKFKNDHESTLFSICESKAKQHKSSKKRAKANHVRIMGHTDYSERNL